MEFLFLLAGTIFGYSGGPWWTMLVTAGFLTLAGSQQDQAIAARFSRLGAPRVFTIAMAQSLISNLVFAMLSFGLGRAIAAAMPAPG